MLRARRASLWAELVGHRPQQTDPVFPDQLGKPQYKHGAAPTLRADLKRIGLSTEHAGHAITMKSARRSFATWLHEAGVEETIIGRLMGHAAITVTGKHYTAADLERLHTAVCSIQLDLRAGEVVALDAYRKRLGLGRSGLSEHRTPNRYPYCGLLRSAVRPQQATPGIWQKLRR
ncbi:MAG TPA: tyrosine-type recombinase/integrase [Polyangiaceae bacterium]|nr:tyrosine-type recombinase/integrase [Polyangiaceae bacterium]